MQKNLVIVESPSKAKTIEKFLGEDYKVISSYGHIRDLRKNDIGINVKTLEPEYEIPEEKRKIVRALKDSCRKSEKVWLASDEDREGEAISWHLCEVLGLDEEKTNRIVFHEITKQAILEAINNPRRIDMNLVYAQQARRVLDRIVGFKISPILWRKVKPKLSAGRVQSVAVRLIVEREREIQSFKPEVYYRVSGLFTFTTPDGIISDVKAELSTRFSTHDQVTAFLEKCKDAQFEVESVIEKPLKRSPAPPFTTSTLQQEAARKLGLPVAQTMMIAQRLYENGDITYMRTDSVNLSKLCLGASKKEITDLFGEQYSHSRQYHTQSKGAQEAHEAIRPTYMNKQTIEGTAQEVRLYELIWKRTVASQMADAEMEKTTVVINVSGTGEQFIANGEVVKFDGFMKVYNESTDDEEQSEEDGLKVLPPMKAGQQLNRKEISAVERFTLGPARYNEASLVHKLEELGIGRPSTYAPIISTIQLRGYVRRGDRKGEERIYTCDTLTGETIKQKSRKEIAGSERGRLIPTDIGLVVNDFLLEYFPDIMDYNFTAKVERKFDEIAEGSEKWTDMMNEFYKNFEPVVEKTMNSRLEHKAGERLLGNDPKTGKPVFVKIGRYGSVLQLGMADDEDKPVFAKLPAGMSLETVTLEPALKMFELPRTLGEYEGLPVVVGMGRFGPYVLHDNKFVSLPKGESPFDVTLDEAKELIEKKRQKDKERIMKQFSEDSTLMIVKGRFGPFLSFDGKNYPIPKELLSDVQAITFMQCMQIVNTASGKTRKTRH